MGTTVYYFKRQLINVLIAQLPGLCFPVKLGELLVFCLFLFEDGLSKNPQSFLFVLNSDFYWSTSVVCIFTECFIDADYCPLLKCGM